MTKTQGAGVRSVSRPARNGLSIVIPGSAPLRFFHRVPPELIPQGSENLRAVRLVLARSEPRLERQRDDRRGDILIDGGLHGPPAFARVGDPALDRLQIAVVLQCALEKLEE